MRNFLFFSAISYNFLTIPEKDFLVGQRYGIYETEDFDKEGRDGNRKGDRCMSRDDKRIKKWRSAGTLGELYLKEMAEQGLLLETIDSEQATPSLSQAQRMKKLSQSGELNEDTMLSIMMEQKKPEKNDITLSGEKLRKYFPRSYTPFQIENTIFKLLDAWQKKRQRDQSR